ncbi:MAG TPA: carboxymuconolactone decarboxylase family protein [Geobacteraceae bacterium]|nr:carboxymuconolactone decarboxylase family protein [Geobacteraceae bacterium]
MSRQPAEHYLNLKTQHGDLIAAVEALGTVARRSGPLDDKTVHLVQLGAAAAIRSHGSVHSHAIRALEAGATPDEVRHAVIVLTSTIGFPTVAAALSWVDDVIGKL